MARGRLKLAVIKIVGSPSAVFISYASQDSETAAKICAVLQEARIEVWLDQSELQGGDAWDEKIRRQVKECGLFLAIVSAATEARREGYFRIEWRLAAERTLGIAEGTPFLLPVVIDSTNEQQALVPAEFKKVQWVRLKDGIVSPDFVTRVQRLVSPGFVFEREIQGGMQGSGSPAGSRRWRFGFTAAMILAAAGSILYLSFRRVPIGIPRPATVEAVNPKSIAVLPFANMSENKENGFFCDGVQDELLTDLASLRELQVASRTTAARFRDSPKSIPEIGKELHVAYILEGSVRRSGTAIRVTAQLINALTDTHVWAKSYDREVKDVFSLQSELASTIASALQVAINPREQSLLDRKPTESTEAHDLVMKAQSLDWGTLGMEGVLGKEEALYEAALKLDPNYAEAWVKLALVEAKTINNGFDTTPQRRQKAEHALSEAVRLAGDSPELLSGVGNACALLERDLVRATPYFQRVRDLQPNSANAHLQMARVLNKERRYSEAIAETRAAIALEPSNLEARWVLIERLQRGRRWAEAIDEERKVVAMRPNDLFEAFSLTQLEFQSNGDKAVVDRFFEGLSPGQASLPEVEGYRKDWAFTSGDLQKFLKLDESQPSRHDYDSLSDSESASRSAVVYLAAGDVAGARARLGTFPEEARRSVQKDPDSDRAWSNLALIEAILGNRDAAKAAIQKATELGLAQQDDWLNMIISLKRSYVFSVIGDKAAAVAELSSILSKPGYYSVFEFKSEPWYWSLHGDPGFEALRADRRNQAPLF